MPAQETFAQALIHKLFLSPFMIRFLEGFRQEARKKPFKTVDKEENLDIAQWNEVRGEHQKTGNTTDGNLFPLVLLVLVLRFPYLFFASTRWFY